MPRRALRRLIAGLLALAVLFAHTAVLAYSCQLGTPSDDAVVEAPCPAHAEEAVDSQPVDSGNLCKVHCETATLPDVSATVVAMPAANAQTYVVRPIAGPALHAPAPEPPGAAPPLILRTSRLLI